MPVILEALTTVPYSNAQAHGIVALTIVGVVSFVSILVLGVVMATKAYKYGGGILPQTHVAPYFTSLLIANFIQAIGSILNINWLIQGGTAYEPACVAQGAAKNIGNVGTALWSLILAFHLFDVLFLRRKQRQITLWATVMGTWIFIFCIDMFGPVFLQAPSQGPFFGVSGHWCWITSNYPRARVFLEYMFMFIAAFFCGIIHSIVFLRLRGNLSGDSWRNIRFRRIPSSDRWALKLARDEVDSKMYKVAMQLMWYPLIYTIGIIPIAVARFVEFSGHVVPFWLTISADFLFNLNGFFNVLLFAATYKRLPEMCLPTLSEPRRSIHNANYGITPFVISTEDECKASTPQANTQGVGHRESVSTLDSFESADSTTLLTMRQES